MRVLPVWVLLSALLLSACAASQRKSELTQAYGEQHVHQRVVDEPQAQGIDYWNDVQPILNQRCVVCHGCYDAPCQLKLSAPEGVDRGANKEKVYVASRLLATKLTRLFEDAHTTEEWREKDFYPVLNERQDSAEANLEGSVLYQMLRLKREHALPQTAVLQGFDLSIDREQSCPKIEEFAEYEKEHPSGGMPYALPGLSDAEFETLKKWIVEGSKFSERPVLPQPAHHAVERWESFLNQPDKKSQLMARYVYEHLFLAHLYFAELTNEGASPLFFNLVRSKTPPGKTLEKIATRRPFDAPGTERVYYRFERLKSTVLEKTHLPYELSDKRLKRYQELFIESPFEVKELPGYEPHLASNPFATFLQIPVGSRYRFLLDDAEFFIGGFIKGPVCRGQAALNVINDRFWITFVDPAHSGSVAEAKLYAEELPVLEMPAGDESNSAILLNWTKYSKKEKKFLRAKAKFLNEMLGKKEPVTLDLVWDGGGKNTNAALTVMRHEDSATVVRGFLGNPPKTSWVLGYGLFERIHYLLVAGFDVYGNVGHQLVSRHYMDFLRMEAEMNFLTLLPRAERDRLRDEWYEGAEKEAREFMNGDNGVIQAETGIVYTSMNPELELYEKLIAHLGTAVDAQHAIDSAQPEHLVQLAFRLESLQGGPVRHFPQLSFVELLSNDVKPHYLTLVRDNAHSNITSLFHEDETRRPQRDRLTVLKGLVGAYPNSFFQVKAGELDDFVTAIEKIHSHEDYMALRDHFGVLRSATNFWHFSDTLHQVRKARDPIRGGLFDLNRLENR